MRRFFLKNFLFVLLVNVLIKPVWIFFIDRTVQNRLGHETYGRYMALFNLAIIFQIIMDFGLTSYNSKLAAQQEEKIPQLFPSLIAARFLLSILYSVVVVGVALLLGYRGYELFLLGGVLVIQGLNSLVLFLRSTIAGIHRFKADAIFSALDKLLMIAICGFILLTPYFAKQFKLSWFIAAQQVSYGITAIAAILLLRKLLPLRRGAGFNSTLILKIIKDSVPYAVLIFLMGLYLRSDMMLLERLLPNGQRVAGLYYSSFRLLDAANVLGLSVAGMLLPMFGRMISLQQNVAGIVRLAANILLPAAFVLSVYCWFFGQELISFLMEDVSANTGLVLGSLLWSFPAYCLVYIFSTLLTAAGKLSLLIKFALVCVVLNFGMNLVLIPHQAELGAAIAATVTQWTMALLSIWGCYKFFQLRVDVLLILKHALVVLFLLIAGYVLFHYQVHFIMAGMLLLFITGVLFATMRFFSRAEWGRVLQLR